MDLVTQIKSGILRGIARSGGRGFITEQISDEGIRAVSELLVEGLIREDDSDDGSGMVVLVITRRGAEAAA